MMKQQQKKLLCSLLSSALLWGTPGVALAEETEEVYAMDEVVVTASRIATKITETAADVTVINRAEMEKKNMKTVTEALVQSGIRIEAEGGGAADVSRVMLNGSERVIILVDGRRVNWEQNSGFEKGGPDLASLPSLSSIERIEVVRGAASSLYGSAGVGGVVNIITRKGEENRIQASTEFGSWNARRYTVQAGGKSGDTGYMVTAERSTQNNYEYKDPTTGHVVTMPNSDFTRNTASVRLDKDLGEDRTLTFYFDHLSEEAGYPIAKPGLMNHNPYAVRQTVQNNVSLAYKWQQGENITNNFRIYRNHYNAIVYHGTNNSDPASNDSYNFARDNTADGIEWNQTRRINDRHTLIGGFDWRNASVDMPGRNLTEHKLRNLGAFLEERWTFDDKWTLNGGLRWDDSSIHDSESTIRLSLNRKVNNDTNVYLSWGQVYQGPNVDMLYYPRVLYSYGNPYVYKGNPNLKPETGHTTTLGVNTKLPGGTVVQASLFSSYLKNAMKWQFGWDSSEGMISWRPINIAEQKRRGLDLTVTHPLSQCWDVTAGYSYLRTRENNHDGNGYQADISNSSPNAYRLGAFFHNDTWNFSIMERGATGRSLDGFTSKRYWVTDVAVSYRIKPEIKIYANVYNLTNRAYEVTYTESVGRGGLPMASRHFVIGVEGKM